MKNKGRKLAAVSLCIISMVALSAGFGIIGFHYPRVIQNEPLLHPRKVVRLEGTNIVLQDGLVIGIESMDSNEISNKLQQSNFYVDVDDGNDAYTVIYARQDSWVCGTPWAKPIVIPLIPDDVYKNRRQLVALGKRLGSSKPQSSQGGDR